MLRYLQTKVPVLKTDQHLSLFTLCESSQSWHEIHETSCFEQIAATKTLRIFFVTESEIFEDWNKNYQNSIKSMFIVGASALWAPSDFLYLETVYFWKFRLFPSVHSLKKIDPTTKLSVRRSEQILTKTVRIIFLYLRKKESRNCPSDFTRWFRSLQIKLRLP